MGTSFGVLAASDGAPALASAAASVSGGVAGVGGGCAGVAGAGVAGVGGGCAGVGGGCAGDAGAGVGGACAGVAGVAGCAGVGCRGWFTLGRLASSPVSSLLSSLSHFAGMLGGHSVGHGGPSHDWCTSGGMFGMPGCGMLLLLVAGLLGGLRGSGGFMCPLRHLLVGKRHLWVCFFFQTCICWIT